ncbi:MULTISPECIES: alpha/beta hydrolase [unclassified Carboxylicivirga]|uniref:alpha/beta hydrolase n=1 Tax=Carboxylicivirga TaxID=1628153 RepID=UPI003D3403E4
MTKSNLFISVRNVIKPKDGTPYFGNEPGTTTYLDIPNGEKPHPENHRVNLKSWIAEVLSRAEVGKYKDGEGGQSMDGYSYGDLLIFVHGYNNSMEVVMKRHDLLQKRLSEKGFKGAIISFDWPSDARTLNYLEDRSDAKATASKLVKDGIALLAANQVAEDRNKCDIDVHLLGHSTGAYVIREAFYEANQNRRLSRINWQVSQIVFIGGDIARRSLSARNPKSQALFQHSVRITNYQNPFDRALKLSNVKRFGVSPRIGRVGVPDNKPETVVNVNVGDHWRELKRSDNNSDGSWSHSWHFDDPTFADDLVYTLNGDIDRNSIPTRVLQNGNLTLKK